MSDVLFQDVLYAAAGATPKRDAKSRAADVRNVKDFGATGDGSTDDTTAINSCFAAALASGHASGGITTGAVVFFPPGAYKVTSSISAAAWNGSVSIEGSGMYNTRLFGNINGFVLDKPDGTGAVIQSIRNMTIDNQNTTLGTGGLRFAFVSSANLESLLVGGMIGLDAGADQFQCRYANIVANGPENQVPGSIGIIGSNATFVGCNVLGYDTGYLIGGITYPLTNSGAPACNLIGCRAEVCNIGFNLGKNILGNGSGSGVMMLGCQSERCYETIVVTVGAPFSVLGGSFTGTRGPGKYFHLDIGGSLTWSSTGGGKATLVIPSAMPSLDSYGWTSGNRYVIVEGASPTGYNVEPPGVLATRTGTRSFTYPLVSNPGGANTETWADWSFRCQSGIKLLTAQQGSISGVAFGFGDLEVAALDFGSMDGGLLTVENTTGSWVLPPGQRKAGIKVQGCSIGTLGMAYADLPGQAGVWLNAVVGGALEGMEYNITDCNTATWGATAAGGGSNHVKIRYNGSAWTVVGK